MAKNNYIDLHDCYNYKENFFRCEKDINLEC